MTIKELQTRIALKYDSYAAWTTSPGKDLVLLAGELGICHVGDANQGSQVVPTVLFKVGDGTKKFHELPWASAKAADVYNWAKSETVVLDGTTIKFKTGDAVNHTIDLSSFATDAEVKTIKEAIESRVTDLENKFTGEGSVSALISTAKQEAIDAAATDATNKANAAEAAAKDYTDEVIGDKANGEAAATGIRKEIADAEAAAKSYTDGKVSDINAELTSLDSRLDTIEGEGDGSVKKALADAKTYAEGEADAAEAAAKAYAKEYADGLAGNYDAAGSAATAEQNAKDYTDDEVDKLVAEDLRLAGLIGDNATAIGNEETARINAVNAINTKIGTVTEGKDVVTMISDAQAAAEANAATTAQSKVDTLANGQVKTNTDAIAANASEITRVEGLVTAEAKAREDGDKALDERLVEVEAFFKTAEGETLDTALDTLKEIQVYLNGEGSATGGIIGRVAQAETDIDNLETRATNLETRANGFDAADAAIQGRLDVIEGEGAGSVKKAQADAEATAKSYTDGRETAIRSELKTAYEAYADAAEADAVTTAKAYTDGKVTELSAKDTEIAGNVTTLQNIVDGYTGTGSIKTAVEAAASAASTADGKAVAAQAAADAAQGAADAAQGTADAVKSAVENGTTGLAATKAIADKNKADIADLTTRIGTAEGAIDALEATVDTATTGLKDRMTAAEGKITSLQTLTGDASKGNEALYTEVTRVAGLVDDANTGLAATKVVADRADAKAIDNAARIKAIEDDYLKAADMFIFNCGTATTVTHKAAEE